MMQHDRRGRLLRVELVLVGQHDADLRRLEQAQELLLVPQLRAGRVAEGVARAAIALAEHGIEVAGVLVAEAELAPDRSEEHTSELPSLMRISYAVFCLQKNTTSIQT